MLVVSWRFIAAYSYRVAYFYSDQDSRTRSGDHNTVPDIGLSKSRKRVVNREIVRC